MSEGGEGPGLVAGDAGVPLDLVVRRAEGVLAAEVHGYFLFRYDGARLSGQERVDTGQIRFLLQGSGEMAFPAGYVEPLRPMILAGPGSAMADFRMDGPIRTFAVMLRAASWRSLIGLPAEQATDHSIDAAGLFGPEWTTLYDRLRGLDDIDAMIAAVEPVLLARRMAMPPVSEEHRRFLQAVREWARSDDPAIDDLYALVAQGDGPGPRQVQRLCLAYYGNPPNRLKRKFRAIRAAQKIHAGVAMAEVVAPFTDQSHMINEVKHFIGLTPTMLRTSDHPGLALRLDNENFHPLPESSPAAG